MREYEFTVVYDLAVSESGGDQATIQALTAHVQARGGQVIAIDRWGRRRMAYPIKGAIDGDYLVSRIELPTDAVHELSEALRIDETIYRHLIVRADELPPPPPPREPRRPRAEPQDAQGAVAVAPVAPDASAAPPEAAVAEGSEPEPAPEPEPAVTPAPAESASTGDEVPGTPVTVDDEVQSAE